MQRHHRAARRRQSQHYPEPVRSGNLKRKSPASYTRKRGISIRRNRISRFQNLFNFPSSSLLSNVRWVGPAAPNPSSDTEFDES